MRINPLLITWIRAHVKKANILAVVELDPFDLMEYIGVLGQLTVAMFSLIEYVRSDDSVHHRMDHRICDKVCCKAAQKRKAKGESIPVKALKISDPAADKLAGVLVMHPVCPAVDLKIAAEELCEIGVVRSDSTEAYEMIKTENS
jgi:hypothetical protein